MSRGRAHCQLLRLVLATPDGCLAQAIGWSVSRLELYQRQRRLLEGKAEGGARGRQLPNAETTAM